MPQRYLLPKRNPSFFAIRNLSTVSWQVRRLFAQADWCENQCGLLKKFDEPSNGIVDALYNISIMATVHPLPPIKVYIDKPVSFEMMEEQIKEKVRNTYDKACRLCEIHRVLICIVVACLCIGSIVISVILKSGSIVISPCYYYTSDTLASDVSVQCLNNLWTSFQCSTALESSPTWHWWIQSPQGKTMVKCNASYMGTMCGAGSYQTLINYLPLCNPHFGQ